MKKRILGLVTFAVIIVFVFMMNTKAEGSDMHPVSITGVQYQEAENQYIEQVRDMLTENGFCNAGINLEKSTTNQGSLIYTLSIHHRRFEKMTDEQKRELKDSLEEINLDVRFSKVSVLYI